MPHERFFIDDPLLEGTDVSLTGTEFHHLFSVMRLKTGAGLELINGRGGLAQGVISSLSSQSAKIHICSSEKVLDPYPPLILAQAIPRFAKLEMILEKGTELGVSEFWLFPGLQSEKEVFSSNQQRRIQLIIQGACKQCGRLFLPKIVMKPPLLEWENLEGNLFFGDLDGSPLANTIKGKTFLFIGPEKGWDLKEKHHLSSTLHAQPFKLHHHTLRTDTAAITGLSLLSYHICAGVLPLQ